MYNGTKILKNIKERKEKENLLKKADNKNNVNKEKL
jgi:hypothetical protein